MSVAGAFADAPPIIAKETPAAAHTGKAVFERFRLNPCFAFAIAEPLYQNSTDEPARHISCGLQPSKNRHIALRTEMTGNDVDVRHADGLRISASTLRVGRHRGWRRSGNELLTRDIAANKAADMGKTVP